MKYTKKVKKVSVALTASMLCCTLALSPIINNFGAGRPSVAEADSNIKKIDNMDMDTSLENYFDSSVVYKLSDAIDKEQEISVIVELSEQTLLDSYMNKNGASIAQSIAEYAQTADGAAVNGKIYDESYELKNRIAKAGFEVEFGEDYNVILSGFEVTLKAQDFNKLEKVVGDDATLIVGEEYEKCETQVVNNDVDIDESTGIFNSTDSNYDGSGTVIAVLDTGLDYTHSAFEVSRFTGEEVLGMDGIAQVIGDSAAAKNTAGLTASDVYINKKIPFAYDYADKDSDVYPLNSEHGTHVSGVIVGNDDVIRGVAPNAQLVSMKVFSDITDGARTSWLLSALEDCVLLGVDVINMSLGSSCGFSNSQDDLEVEEVYNKVREAGISLVTAASNDYNSTFGSEKNGNLGLTSNPDSGTVGSPSTYGAALSVASVSGTKTPYLIYNDTIMYFHEASDQASQPKHFVDEILSSYGVTEKTFDYVLINGIGSAGDYAGVDVTGKIVLVKRGLSTFEEKVRIADNAGAAGIIIYNNVSGDISMTIGKSKLPACSISQDDGELLAASRSGQIKISTSQVAGPFMSDFSSWGPTPDLKIKPEITAHGGDILSAVPGQSYDRLSGTSMASPNQAGVTALVRQYVKDTFPSLAPLEVTARVNQLMMSTADIVYNSKGLPYAVRKQGSGLANLNHATSTPAYISTFDENGQEMDKAKLEIGDDANKTGVYEMTFAVNNISSSSLTYKVGGLVLTEGVSTTLTVRGDRTVTQDGYLLDAAVEVVSVANGSNSGNDITVSAGQSAKVTVKIKLTDGDKEYLDKYFKNGMYIEGFITLEASDGNDINLNVPYLAFYGDWTQAPLFDLDYFETDPDEKNFAIDADQKTMADAYATKPIGGLYRDYIAYLGSYQYQQNPSATQIAANRDHIALTNQTGEDGGVNNIYGIWAGMLRGADHIDITITDDVTGEVIFNETKYNQRKSYYGGGSIIMSSIDVDFNMSDFDLKNNTRYTVKLQAYMPYGEDGGKDTNLRNTFEFTFTTDFQAPVVTGCEFTTEYDPSTKKTRYFANIEIYDNHYSQAAFVGMVVSTKDNENSPYYDPDTEYAHSLASFDRYLSPLYSDFNSTYTLTYELTDYIDQIKNYSYNGNSFIVQVMDYALNTATYEISIPDEITSIKNFTDSANKPIDSLTLSPNEVFTLNLNASPATNWSSTANFTSSDENVVGVVNGKLIARKSGSAVITAKSNSNDSVVATLNVTVLAEGAEGYVRYDKPVTDSFKLTEYYINKAYYFGSTEERDLGLQDSTVKFAGSYYALSFYPSESVTIHYDLKAYFPDDVEVKFISNNTSIATVDENGTITALKEGSTSISVLVYMDGKKTFYSQSISLVVKNPYTTNGFYLMKYTGLGGVVEIPAEFGVTEIYQYAFSNYEYVEKDENDEISKEDPMLSKAVPIGENTITKVIIPEGVKVIDSYAFANLTALEEVVLPSTLKKIQSAAFEGCTKLSKINLENVQFINQNAFHNCPIRDVDLSSIVAIGNRAFEMDSGLKITVTEKDADGKDVLREVEVTSELKRLELPASAQSLGARAFYNNAKLQSVSFKASSVKLGDSVFAFCKALSIVDVNASVIPSYAFNGCTSLAVVKLGKDVSVIGHFAFTGSALSIFQVDARNPYIKVGSDGTFIVSKDGKTLVNVAPSLTTFAPNADEQKSIVTIGDGAFSGNQSIRSVVLPNVTKVSDFAFAYCTKLARVTLGTLTEIGNYSFYYCSVLSVAPSFENVKIIGESAFESSGLVSVNIADGTEVGAGAFGACDNLTKVTIGNNVEVGEGAFMASLKIGLSKIDEDEKYVYAVDYFSTDSTLTTVVVGDNVTLGLGAFFGQLKLTNLTIGKNVIIGDRAFYLNTALKNLDLRNAISIGEYAFAAYRSDIKAYETNMLGQLEQVGTAGSYYIAPAFTSVEISSATEIGEGAFYGNVNLTNVILGDNVKMIGAGAFAVCRSLEDINLDKVEFIDVNAFSNTALKEADLGKAVYVGSGAFAYNTLLEEVKLADGVMIDDSAFAGDEVLTSINIGAASYVGSYAFAECAALTEADLTGAEFVDDFAFALSGVTTVKFGENLSFIGENPFMGCAIGNFTDKDGNTDFEITEDIVVKDGVLYSVAPNGGLLLISYPALKEDATYKVAEGTVRISAGAFAYNAKLVSVELPYELGAVGDKAFYQCAALTVVTFKSVKAPILEEQYDEDYQVPSNLPLTGYYGHMELQKDDLDSVNGEGYTDATYKGLGIVPFYMWNYSPTYFFYGANFIDYIGKQDQTLIFVAPSNGEYYDSFVISRYYTSKVDGAVAPYQATLDAISLINQIPDYITLDDNVLAAVEAARAAYDSIASLEQQALVSNYGQLTAAENTIKFLQAQQNPDDPNKDPDDEEQHSEPVNNTPLIITLSVLTGVFGLIAIAVTVLLIVEKRKTNAKNSANDSESQATENK